jgi:hypothetical protein
MNHRTSITEALALIFEGIAKLKVQFPEKAFTIDGRLVGDIGEVIAALEYDVKLYEVQTPAHDGETSDGRKVQVKVTFKDKLTMTAVPELYLGLKLTEDGGHREVYNGPGQLIADRFAHRSGLGEKQLSFPISVLEDLSENVPNYQRVQRRAL